MREFQALIFLLGVEYWVLLSIYLTIHGRYIMRAGTGTLLNFTLKFGNKNLKDYLDDIVKPAFLNNNIRTVGKKTSFLFLNVEEFDFGLQGTEDIALVGRFVKDTVLESTQVLEGNKLIDQRDELRSSPSATFALFLNDHRLLYFADAPHAPAYSSFKSTALNFLKRERRRFINSEFERFKSSEGKKVTKKNLEELISVPTLNILPIPNSETATKFVENFESLQTLTFKVLEGNDEAQASQWFQDMKSVGDSLNADGTARFNNKDGLEQTASADLIAGATENGITKIRATGTGSDGERLVKTTEDLTVEVELNPIPPTKRVRIRRLLETFSRMGLR